jgi:branched-chain amino acid transport system permease protein
MAGAYAGGVLLGLFEALGPQVVLGGLSWELPLVGWSITVPGLSQLTNVVAFTALVLVLIFKPTGLFGERLAVEERG